NIGARCAIARARFDDDVGLHRADEEVAGFAVERRHRRESVWAAKSGELCAPTFHPQAKVGPQVLVENGASVDLECIRKERNCGVTLVTVVELRAARRFREPAYGAQRMTQRLRE